MQYELNGEPLIPGKNIKIGECQHVWAMIEKWTHAEMAALGITYKPDPVEPERAPAVSPVETVEDVRARFLTSIDEQIDRKKVMTLTPALGRAAVEQAATIDEMKTAYMAIDWGS